MITPEAGGLWKSALANAVFAVPLAPLRRLFARRILRWQMGDAVSIGRGVTVANLRNLAIGDHVVINPGVHLDLRGGISIGSHVDIAAGVSILTADHDPDSPDHTFRLRPVTIGSRVWIARHAIVLPGSVVGDGVTVAAGAVVHGQLKEDSIYAGNPAVVLRGRDPQAQSRFSPRPGIDAARTSPESGRK